MGTPARDGLPLVDQFDERDPLHWIAVGGTRQMRHNRSYARGSAPCRRSRSASQRLEFHNGRALVSEGCPAPHFVEGGVPRHGGAPASRGFHRPSAMWLPPTCRPSQRLAASRLPLQACPVGRRQRRPSSPSRRGRALTSPSRQSISNAAARATANISGQRSTPAQALHYQSTLLKRRPLSPLCRRYRGEDPLAAVSTIEESNRPMGGSAAPRSTALVSK